MKMVQFTDIHGHNHRAPIDNIDDTISEDGGLLSTKNKFYVVVRGKKYQLHEEAYNRLLEDLKHSW